jgi:hypothetical protein
MSTLTSAAPGADATPTPRTRQVPDSPRAQRRRITRVRSRDDFLAPGIPAGEVNSRIRPSVNAAARSGAHVRSRSPAGSHAKNPHSREASSLACFTLDGPALTTGAVTAGRARAHAASARLRGVKRRTHCLISFVCDMHRRVR